MSSFIAQSSLTQSTNKLNQAIERMSTGFKINHASNNAANYSIATDMNTQLNAYQVAQDNISMGMDLVSTAQDSISLMQDHGSRIRSLVTQALNGTYGDDSQKAIASEINARVAEINRLYNTTEYNGINLFKGENYDISQDALVTSLTPNEDGFIQNAQTYKQAQVDTMTSIQSVTGNYTSGTKYKIMTVDDLEKLANDVNSGKTHTGAIFVLGADLDLSGVEWTPIGDNHTNSNASRFRGSFDGNGHIIKNLEINSEAEFLGLFGETINATIKNVGLEDVNFNCTATRCGTLVGYCNGASSVVSNCFSTGNISVSSYGTGTVYAGGLLGSCAGRGTIDSCYSSCDVTSSSYAGGLAGNSNGRVSNSFSTGNVSGGNSGGLIALAYGIIENCYSTSDVYARGYAGGLVGNFSVNSNNKSLSMDNVAAYGNVFSGSSGFCTGSLIGYVTKEVNTQIAESISITNARCLESDLSPICSVKNYIDSVYTVDEEFDMSNLLDNITILERPENKTCFQVGINSDDSCQMSVDTSFFYNLNVSAPTENSIIAIDKFLNKLNSKQTELGAVSNRLDSALESSGVNIENLTSSLSTTRDADIGKVSSEYIRQQILQQACSTLLSTANQSPSIALQLI